MSTHIHTFIPSEKKDISYCKLCYQLSYKGIIANFIPLNCENCFNINPLKFKFKPISYNINYNSQNHLKYLEFKNKGISRIKFLVNSFGLNKMTFYKSICFMNKIFLENEISINDIDNISPICILLVVKYSQCCRHFVTEEYLTKDEMDILYYHSVIKNGRSAQNITNLKGLFNYIKIKVKDYKYWEVLCLKYLNYDLGRYSAYDYLILFFKLGIIFCKDEVLMIDKLKMCLNILDMIIYDKKFYKFSQYTFAMSIIKLIFENEKYFDKATFKHIYGVDLSKDKYIKCSNLINSIINKSIYSNIVNNIVFLNILNNQEMYSNKYKNLIKENYFYNQTSNKNKNEEEKIDQKGSCNNKGIIYKYNNFFDFGQFNPIINNKNIIINNNYINVNNFFDVKYNFDNNCIYNNYFYNKNFCFNS